MTQQMFTHAGAKKFIETHTHAAKAKEITERFYGSPAYETIRKAVADAFMCGALEVSEGEDLRPFDEIAEEPCVACEDGTCKQAKQ